NPHGAGDSFVSPCRSRLPRVPRMINTLLAKVIGTQNDRELKRLRPVVAQVNELEPSIRALSDAELRGRTPMLRQKVSQGASLDDVLPEAFAVVREAGRRV